jgi:hypothetical protein
MSVVTVPISVGIHDVSDVNVSKCGQFLIVSYKTGAVNLHQIGDMSFNFVV